MSVQLPFSQHVHARNGLAIEINGVMHGDKLVVNIQQGPQHDNAPNIGLHVNVRENENCIVLNSCQYGTWGSEERHALSVRRGQPFQLRVNVHAQKYDVHVNAQHIKFWHRTPIQHFDHLMINGHAQINGLIVDGVRHGFQQQGGVMISSHGPAFPQGGQQYPPSGQQYPSGGVTYNPSIPFTAPLNGGMWPGRMITIIGSVPYSASEFQVNLQTSSTQGGQADLALHMNVRFREQCVVRNHREYGNWGSEERHGGLPAGLQPGQQLQLMVLCEAGEFKLAVNGQHFTGFRHRLQPLQRVDQISISGDVQVRELRTQ